jgi:hypothetical protein
MAAGKAARATVKVEVAVAMVRVEDPSIEAARAIPYAVLAVAPAAYLGTYPGGEEGLEERTTTGSTMGESIVRAYATI